MVPVGPFRSDSMKTKGDIARYVAEQIEDVSLGARAAAAIAPDDRIIDDLGLDSLDYATVLLSCEKWLDVKVSEDDVDWRAIDTVEKLAGFLEQQQRR
jgi:acyl carrier protein